MKNNYFLYLVLSTFLLPSCANLKLSRSLHTPTESFVAKVDSFRTGHPDRIDQNDLVIGSYAELDSLLNTLYSEPIMSLPGLNLSASFQIRSILESPPRITKFTDFVGMTRVRKTLSSGNTYIFHYVRDLWTYFYEYMQAKKSDCFEEFWTEFLIDYPSFALTNEHMTDSTTGFNYVYLAFNQYYRAMVDADIYLDRSLFHETILLGNLYFFKVEQLVAQEFIRKALTIRPFGSNPFNLAGRKVEVNLDERSYKNRGVSLVDLNQFKLESLKKFIKQNLSHSSGAVKYHVYQNRMNFMYNIGINEHLHFIKHSKRTLAHK